MSPSALHLLPLLLFLLISQIANISRSQTIPAPSHPHDKTVLLRIKNKLGNPSSLSSWDPNTDCCTQWGPLLCNDQGHITALTIIEAHDINGPIPPYLDNLLFLTGLYFINVTNLSGPVPSYIGKLTNLTSLVISGTKVTDHIPDFLGQFINMFQLNLPNNQFFGPVPDSLGRMKSLIFLDLSFNRLSGPVPICLPQIAGLIYVGLQSNNFSGPIPSFFYKLVNVSTIALDFNSLTGPIPDYLGHMPSLETLSLSNNQLTGPIPKSWSHINIQVLNLGHNQLTGNASFLFERSNTNIYEIYVDNNFLKFDFTNVDLGPRIVAMNVSHNMIYGSLPKRFGQLLSDSVDVSYNRLCGPIPSGELFKEVDPAIFSHNKCLCGGPLLTCK